MNRSFARCASLLFVALLLAVSVVQGQTAGAPAWDDFLAWYKAAAIADPGKVFAAYAEKLKHDGLGEAAVGERIALLRETARTRSRDLTGIHFDKIYASPMVPFRTEPSAYLVRTVEGRTPGTALDVAMGQGRNAIYLASKGWTVTGYDLSGGGLASARAQAARQGVALNAVLAGHDDFDFGTARWDLIVMAYAAAPMDDPAFLRRVRESLKPGGIVVVEQFNAAPDKASNNGPANALLKSFEGLRVIHYEDVVDRSEWGGMLCRIGRVTAEKE
ncbi:MAG TPA: methyltransferase domain-containing protein [Vicinamibacterales bacterium]|jgi:2-polyprenyl-3-methyl-5-hydroxy-6-metoxy-1,4-benzoquinol methylase